MSTIKPTTGSMLSGVQAPQKNVPLNQQPEKVAQQFEALLIKQMIDSMWKTVPKDGLLTGSHEESLYRDMWNEAIATSISEGRGIGVRDVILRDMNKGTKSDK
ncbi:MAG: rod-binding protein [Pseudomonadota bacterium]|jgi:flagellar protein FlgJ